MEVIKDVSKDIEKILDMSECYAKRAVLLKQDFPSLAQSYYNSSTTCLTMMKDFHNEIVSIINDYTKQGKETPAPMAAIYNYLHERFIERAAAIRNLQDLFKQ